MNRLLVFLIAILSFFIINIQAQDAFTRTEIINTLTYEANGFGGIVGNVDFDLDGKKEIYLCNTNSIDTPPEVLIPRLYKFEFNGTIWEKVWSTEAPIPLQNTWPALTWGDLDNDSKPELIWLPVNNLEAALNPNPARILIYEYPGDGSDNMGVSDGFGGFEPNAKQTVVSVDMINIRPCRAVVSDLDSDGKQEIIFTDRAGSSTGDYHIGIWSVSDVPDNGGGLEAWTEEFSGVGDLNISGIGNNWDVNVINNTAYLFGSNTAGSIFPVRFDQGNYTSLTPQPNMIGTLNSFKGSQVLDIDGNSVKEMFVGTMFGSKVYLLQPSADTLIQTLVADFATLGVGRIQGSAFGDIDSDDKVDLIFGCRNNTADLRRTILRLEFQGGDITNPDNYIASAIDSIDYSGSGGGEFGVISVANYDGDTDDEIIFTEEYPRGSSPDESKPVYMLNRILVSVENETDQIPDQFFLNQNFPNPFNPSTQIKFGITEAANVDLRIYDILGSEVAVVINNQYLAAGSYSTKFDAANLASGIYIYKLTAGANTVSKKMQLLK
jgi:hypothetical protein